MTKKGRPVKTEEDRKKEEEQKKELVTITQGELQNLKMDAKTNKIELTKARNFNEEISKENDELKEKIASMKNEFFEMDSNLNIVSAKLRKTNDKIKKFISELESNQKNYTDVKINHVIKKLKDL